MLLLADLVHRATLIAVWLIVVALALILFSANHSNAVVDAITQAGTWLARPFHGTFDVGAAKADRAADWGLAALAYGVFGGMLTRVLASAGERARVARTTVLR